MAISWMPATDSRGLRTAYVFLDAITYAEEARLRGSLHSKNVPFNDYDTGIGAQAGRRRSVIRVDKAAWGQLHKAGMKVGSHTTPPAPLLNRSSTSPATNWPAEQSIKFQEKHRIDINEKIIWGYKDGGRQVPFDAQGKPIGRLAREIIVVKSPQEDLVLDKVIKYAKSTIKSRKDLKTTAQKAEFLKDFVISLMPQGHPTTNEFIMDHVAGTGGHRGAEISLGQLIQAKTGVCRHRSLLFKVLADAVGVPAALVRGNYISNSGSGGHCWNEVVLEKKNRILVDVMSDFIGNANDAKTLKYADMHNNFLYQASDNNPLNTLSTLKRVAFDKMCRQFEAKLSWKPLPPKLAKGIAHAAASALTLKS